MSLCSAAPAAAAAAAKRFSPLRGDSCPDSVPPPGGLAERSDAKGGRLLLASLPPPGGVLAAKRRGRRPPYALTPLRGPLPQGEVTHATGRPPALLYDFMKPW